MMNTESNNEIEFVAHAHSLYFGGQMLPVEIGIAQVLPDGAQEGQRRVRLFTIQHPGLRMTRKDRLVNRMASNKSHGLPIEFEGELSLEEAGRRACEMVGDGLVAVKGLEMKEMFRDMGMPRVVDLKTEIFIDCPKYAELERPDWLKYEHADHKDPWQCSRMVALRFARYVEERRSEESIPPAFPYGGGTFIPPPVPAEMNEIKIDLKAFKNVDRISVETKGVRFTFEFE